MNHTKETIATYDSIAKDYKVIATPENRAWLEDSMRIFTGYLPGNDVLVPGCGEGRDSRYLRTLGCHVTSFDLSDGMLRIARAANPAGAYLRHDLRDIAALGRFHGIWACACLYHLTRDEFKKCLRDIHNTLHPGGIFYCNLKIGEGERYIGQPRKGYPGGKEAQEKLTGNRFYAFYETDELTALFRDFHLLQQRKDILKEGKGAREYWLQKP